MTIASIYAWIEDNPFVKEGLCYCDYFENYRVLTCTQNESSASAHSHIDSCYSPKSNKCRGCGHDNPHTYTDPGDNFKYCNATIKVRMLGSEVKEAILEHMRTNEKSA